MKDANKSLFPSDNLLFETVFFLLMTKLKPLYFVVVQQSPSL